MQGLSAEMVEGPGKTSAHQSRQMGMWGTPSKRHLCSGITPGRTKKGCKVAIVSGCIEKPLKEVFYQTPPGKEKEVIATGVAKGRDELVNEVLRELKEVKMMMEEIDSALKINRALSLKFFVDYVLSIYKVAGGKTVLNDTVERQLAVKHAMEGFKETVPLNEDIQSNLRLLQMVSSKASCMHCNVGSLSEVANAILVIAKDCAHNPELWNSIINEDGLAACQKMFMEVFGDSVEEASTSEEVKYNQMFLIEEPRAK